MSKRDVLQLTREGQRAYYYWPILLMLKKRQLEAKLASSGTAAVSEPAESADLALLRRLGLPLPEDVSERPPPPQQTLKGVRFWLRSATAFDNPEACVLDFVRQLASGGYERQELLRMDASHRAYLSRAAQSLTAALDLYPQQQVYAAARLWAAWHGAEPQDWQPVAAHFLEADTTPVLAEASVETAAADSPFTFGKSSFFGA